MKEVLAKSYYHRIFGHFRRVIQFVIYNYTYIASVNRNSFILFYTFLHAGTLYQCTLSQLQLVGATPPPPPPAPPLTATAQLGAVGTAPPTGRVMG